VAAAQISPGEKKKKKERKESQNESGGGAVREKKIWRVRQKKKTVQKNQRDTYLPKVRPVPGHKLAAY